MLLFSTLFVFCMGGRITPVSLDKVAPDTLEAEIKGQVEEPGIYTLKYGATIKDLIEETGGETAAADLSALNLMEEIRPQEVIVVGKLTASGESEKISLNTAGKEELMKLPGIGEAMAQRILDYRTAHRFTSIEQLMEVSGIGEKKYEKLKEFIAL